MEGRATSSGGGKSRAGESTTHGGKIHKRLIDLHRPFYALINPDSPQVPQYAKYVSSLPESERGIVVPYSFVRASITTREIVLPVEFQSGHPNGYEESTPWAPLAFTRGLRRQDPTVGREKTSSSVDDGPTVEDDGWGGLEPVTVHLHSTIGRDERRRLALKIAMSIRFAQKAPMSGRKPGTDRNDFTTEDDNNLARFIAKRIPDKLEGGRTGNNLYKDLCERTDIYPWAAGHTWQSWRNRYRKKQDYFDPIIDKYSQTRQSDGDRKGEFQYSRGKKRQAPEDSPAVRSRSPVSSNLEPIKRNPATTKAKRPRPLNKNPAIFQDIRSVNQQGILPDFDCPSGSSGKQHPGNASSYRTRSSPVGAQRRTTGSSRHESTNTSKSATWTQSRSQPDQGRQEDNNVRAGSHQTDASANQAHLPTEGPEMAPLMGMDVNENPLMSSVYGDDSDDIHAKAKDLGLSDYLDSGFTSTW
ncbi:unnamed protein product [Rhizoctonia solani]|uniref:DNA-binding protein RAP1 n=1 Tax=Rhizoctonia solani TaxID=456999 RepID=A0A8H3AKM9_9AGAM|nr:unnamed protein product [Rhizoctonia solani]